MRNMGFAMTTAQIKAGTKTVTRRFGWWFLNEGDMVQPVAKAMGLKRGEKVQKLRGPLQVVKVNSEPLNSITKADCILEGFPDLEPSEFVDMLVKHYGCDPSKTVNRIEYAYTD